MDLASGTFSGSEITWKGLVCTINQRNDGSSTQVNQNYVAQPRWYASHVISFSAIDGYTLTGATIECTSASYASVLASGTYTNGAMAKDSGALVMITCNGDFSVKLSAQARVNSVTLTYVQGNASGTTTGGTTQPTDTTGTSGNQGTTTGTPEGGYIFYESFNQNNFTGGNDGQWSGSIAAGGAQVDNTGWTFVKTNGASGCIKLGTSSAMGSAETPTIYCNTNNAMLSFRAGAWAGDATTMRVSTSTGYSQDVEIPSGAFGDFEFLLEGTQGAFTITFDAGAASKSRFFLDEVVVREVAESNPTDTTSSGTDGWYKITIENSLAADGIIFWMSDEYDMSTWTQPTPGNVVVEQAESGTYVAYVRPGYGAALAVMNFGTIFNMGDSILLTSKDSRYGELTLYTPEAQSQESTIYNIYPENNITFYTSRKEAVPNTSKYYRYDVSNSDDYGISLITYDRSIAYEQTETKELWGQTFVNRYFFVKEGATAQVECYVYDTAHYEFDRWESSHNSIDGDTVNPTYLYGYPSNGDTASTYWLGAQIRLKESAQNKQYYTVNLYAPYGGEMVVLSGLDASGQPTKGNYYEDYGLYYVEQGTGLVVRAVVSDTSYVFGHWQSYDDDYNQTIYHGSTNPEISIMPTGNMSLNFSLDPSKPAGWYTVTIEASAIGYGMEEAAGEEYESSYGSHVRRIDGADGSLTAYVQPGYGFYLYMNNKYDNEGNQLTDYGYEDIVRFSSNDPAFNGMETNFTNAPTIIPTRDMTLSVVSIGLPVAKYYSYEVLENNNYGIYLLETDTTIAYERTRYIDGWAERYFYVKEGERARISCSVYDSLNYRFDHWISSHNILNGDSLNPTYIYGILSAGDTVSGFTLRAALAEKVQPKEYYSVTMVNPQGGSISVLNGFLSDYAMSEDSYYVEGSVVYVEKGTGIALQAQIFDSLNYVLGHWSEPYDYNTEKVCGFFPTSDMTISFTIEEIVVEPEYWKVTLGDIDDIYGYYSIDGDYDRYYEDYEYVGDPTSTAGVERRVIYVEKGASVSVQVGAEKQGYVFDHWTSSFVRYDGNTTNPITISPSSDMTLTPVFDCPYWKVLTQTRYYNDMNHDKGEEVNIDVDYDLVSDSADYFMDYEYDDFASYQYFYIRKGTEVPMTYYTRNPYMVLDHWVSNDTAYNGKTADPLMLKPTKDMTLSAVLVNGFWKIELPGFDENNPATVVTYFDRDLFNKDDDNMRNDSATYEPSVYALSAPARARRNNMRDEFGDVFFYSDYVLVDSISGAYAERLAIYVRKGKSTKLYVPYLFLTNDYRFDHWISDDAVVNGSNEHPLVITPAHDMTLAFVLRQAGAVTTIGNTTIEYSDTLSAVIDLSGDGSVKLTIDNGSGQSEIVLDSATIAGAGLTSELNELKLIVEAYSSIVTEGVGIQFDGEQIIIESEDETLLRVNADLPLAGNGINSLYINTSVILTAKADADGEYQPAISGFADVTIADGLAIQEVWYGLTKGNPALCVFSEEYGTFGKYDTVPASAPKRVAAAVMDDDMSDVKSVSFMPATALCIASPNFYVDYIDGKIDVPTALEHFGWSVNGDADNAQQNRKIIYGGHLFILTPNGIFDANGHRVR